MRRIIPVLLLLAAFAAGAHAQTSNVTATITDADSQTWNNGTYTISFVQPPNDATPPVWNGTLMTASQKLYTGSLSGSGVLTIALPDAAFITPAGSLWLFVICPNATAQCGQVALKVTGASPDLSTSLSSAMPVPRFSAVLNAFGYLDVEVTPAPVPGGQYFNVTNQVTRVWSGSAWANQGSGGACSTCALTTGTLGQFAPTTSAQLAGVLSDETGTGLAVFGTNPVLTTPNLGTPSAINLTNATGFPTLNQNTTGSAASLSVSGQAGLITLTGITGTNRIKTVRDAADTLLELGGSYTPTGTWTNMVLATPNLGTPSAVNLTNATATPACATCVTSAASLTNNFLVLAAGAQGVQTNTAFTTDGITKLTIGTSGNGNGQLALTGNTSGAATITAPNVAGTAGNAMVFSNAGSFGGQVTGAGFNSDVNHCFFFTGRGQLCSGSAYGIFVFTSNTTSVAANRLTLGPDNSSNLALCPNTNVLKVGVGGAACTTLSGVTTGTFTGNLYASGANCSSAASPAVCAAASAGSVAIPAGATQTLQVNTSAVTANSQIMLTVDEGLGTKLGVTCNTTVATLTQPVVTARTAATSFTIEEPATTATNPVCVSYLIFN